METIQYDSWYWKNTIVCVQVEERRQINDVSPSLGTQLIINIYISSRLKRNTISDGILYSSFPLNILPQLLYDKHIVTTDTSYIFQQQMLLVQ